MSRFSAASPPKRWSRRAAETRTRQPQMPSVAVRVAVERWLGTDGAGGDIFGEPFYALPNGEKGVVYCSRKQTLSAKLQGIIDNLLCFPEYADAVPTFDPDAVGCEIVDEKARRVRPARKAWWGWARWWSTRFGSSRTRTRAAAGDAHLKRMPASRSAALSQPRSSKAAANAEPSCYAVGM